MERYLTHIQELAKWAILSVIYLVLEIALKRAAESLEFQSMKYLQVISIDRSFQLNLF